MSFNPYNLTILDLSPTFIYLPFREGDIGSAWKSFFSNSPDSSYDATHQATNLASGTSLHSTAMQGASFEISFLGSAIYLYGSGNAGAYTTTLDDREAAAGAPSDNLLASYTKLDYKTHTLSLNVTQAQQINMTSAVLTVGIGAQGASVQNTDFMAVTTNSDGSSYLNSAFSTQGPGPFNTNHDATGYPRVDTNTVDSILSFTCSQASAIVVYGGSNYDHGRYQVTLSPSGGVSNSPRIFNGTSKWFSYDTVIYWESGLDNSRSYTVSIENLDAEYVDIHKVTVMNGVGGTTSSSSTQSSQSTQTSGTDNTHSNTLNTGAIAGISVGAAALLAVALLVGFLCFKRRKPQSASRLRRPILEINASDHGLPLLTGHVEPFVMPSNAPYYDDSTRSSSNPRFTPSKMTPGSSSSRPSTSMGSGGTPDFNPYQNDSSIALNTTSFSAPNTSQGSSFGLGVHKRQPPSPQSVPAVRQEVDAGPVPISPSPPAQEIVLPPGYNPAWSHG